MTTPRDQHDPAHGPTSDLREQLSAFIDGALPAEQARFLLRRLQNDDSLAGRWERWQLAGDVLRGAGPVALPTGFPSRVATAISGSGSVPGPVRRWGRHGLAAALAASVAAVALFVARPVGEGGLASPDGGAAIAVLPPIDVPLPETTPVAIGDVASVPQATAPVRVADAGMLPGTARGVAPPPSSVPRVADIRSGASNPLPAADDGVSPFSSPVPPDARPWPRAVLPGVSGGELFTAGYDPVTEAGDEPRPFAPSRLVDEPVVSGGQVDAP